MTTQFRWISPLPILVILILSALAMPLHESGHWLWAFIVDGKVQILQFTKVTNPDGSTYGSLGGIAAGPLASAVYTAIGIALLLFSKNALAQFSGATLALVSAFQRLTIYVLSLSKGMAGNDEGIVALELGLHAWATAIPLMLVFIAAIVIVWKKSAVMYKTAWFVVTYVSLFVLTLIEFQLDRLIFS
jgi:hypothetical protein